MPRKCTVKECKKYAKWKSTNEQNSNEQNSNEQNSNEQNVQEFVIYSCNEHMHCLQGITLVRVVSNPCKICTIETPNDITEATYGPIINGKRTRHYCKRHVPNHRKRSIKKKIVKTRRCVYCYTTPSYTDDTTHDNDDNDDGTTHSDGTSTTNSTTNRTSTRTRLFCSKHRPRPKINSNDNNNNNNT